MSEITQEMIDKTIEDCPWRRNVAGVYVCTGDILPCAKCIDIGKCDELRKLFNADSTNRSSSQDNTNRQQSNPYFIHS